MGPGLAILGLDCSIPKGSLALLTVFFRYLDSHSALDRQVALFPSTDLARR